jgi:microsomal dipeptidase-like Zn-dependent dipeptidase
MTSAREFSLANKIALIISCVFLLGVFLFSHFFASALKKDITYYVEQTEMYVHSENWEQVRKNIDAIEQRFLPTSDVLKLFYDHEDVDTLNTEISTAKQLAKAEEKADIFLSLENIKSIATYLSGIETFSIPNLF